jgi:uncharacterized NAD(P)/FAD-binding protein YdhS
MGERGDDHILIVGGGFSGAMLAINLVRHAGPRVTLIDRRGQAGFGLAYATPNPVHLLNVRAANMSALPDDPGHFLRWLGEGKAGHAFVPRQTYGRYISGLLDEARDKAPDRLQLLQGEAIGIARIGGGYRVTLAAGEAIEAATVVLAMGNLPPARAGALAGLAEADPRLVSDPWGPALVEGVASLGHVLLLGTGLTAVDVALLLDEAGFAGRITAVSRRGLLPRPHDGAAPPPPLPLPPEPTVLAIARHLRQVSAAIGWRGAIDQLRPYTQHLWQRMTLDERRRFLRHARPWWDVHRHRTAPDVAARIDALRRAGRFEVVRGRMASVVPHAGLLRVAVKTAAGTKALEVDRIVNCTGPGDLGASRDPLIASLRATGLARPDALNLGLDTDHIGRVRDAHGCAAVDLFAVGPLTRGAFWEITAVPDIRRQVWALARRLSDAHWVGGEGL